jgi:hypothetical protein
MNKPRRYWGVGWAKLTPKVSAIQRLYKYTSKTYKNVQNVLGKVLEIRYPKGDFVGEAYGRFRAESPLVPGKFLQKPAS